VRGHGGKVAPELSLIVRVHAADWSKVLVLRILNRLVVDAVPGNAAAQDAIEAGLAGFKSCANQVLPKDNRGIVAKSYQEAAKAVTDFAHVG
jgi:hypothetical protein